MKALNCPSCGHALQCDAGKKQKILLYCWRCQDSNRAELAALARSLSPDAITLLKVQKKPSKEWSEEQLLNRLTLAQQNLKQDKAAQDFLLKRGITLETAQTFGIGCGHYYGEPRIVLPYFSGAFAEELLQLRYRRIRVTDSKRGKWACDKRLLGGRRLFNLPLLQRWDPESTEPLLISESELDAVLLSGFGAAALSVDTAGHRLQECDLLLLRQVKNLVLCFDSDGPGQKCAAHFKELLPTAHVLRWRESVKDIGELRAAVGVEQFTERLTHYIAKVICLHSTRRQFDD